MSHACCVLLSSFISSIFGRNCSCQTASDGISKKANWCHILCQSVCHYASLSAIGICHIFWHSFWHSICHIFDDSLWSRSGWEHSGPGLPLRARHGPLRFAVWARLCDLALAVEVRQGPLWSWAFCSGAAGTTAITSLQLRSGGATLIRGLLFGSGWDHCDLALAVEVRQGPLWFWVFCSGPAGTTAITSLELRSGGGGEGGGGQLTWSLTTLTWQVGKNVGNTALGWFPLLINMGGHPLF